MHQPSRHLHPRAAGAAAYGDRDRGFVLVALLAMLLPLVLIVGATTATMNARSNRLQREIDLEKSLLAAESGLDAAIFAANKGALTSGTNILGNYAKDHTFEVIPTYLGNDGLDNDSDGAKDAMDADEDVFQLEIAGTYRNTTRRIAAYLGPVPGLAAPVAAVSFLNPSINLDLRGTSHVTGFNYDIDGTRGSTAADMPGMSVASPGTTTSLSSVLTGSEPSKVTGVGGTPSLSTTAAIDVTGLVNLLRNAANITLTSKHYASYGFGNASSGSLNVTFRDGDVKFAGNTQGAGILVVTGDLTTVGDFRFDGIAIVLGNIINASGTMTMRGATIVGPGASMFQLRGTGDFQYSQEAVDLARSLSGIYVIFKGWQELSRS